MTEWRPLKRFCHISYGLGQPPKLSESGIPILRATNINNGRIDSDDLIYARVEDLPINRAPLLDEGEILVVRSGAYTGDSARIPPEWSGAAPGYDLRLTPVQMDSQFLAYTLKSTGFLHQITIVRSRAAQPHLNAEELGEVVIPAPSLKVQQSVAAFLDAETARIDALIAKRSHMVALARERSAAVLNYYFSTCITYSRAGIPVGLADQEMVQLGALATVRSGLTLDSGRNLGGSTATHPYLRVANVQDGCLDLQEVKYVEVPSSWSARFELKRGDVLMTEGGDPDKLGRGTVWGGELENCLHQNHIFSVRPTSALLPEYLALITRTLYARLYFEMTASKTTGIASTSSAKISAFRVPIMSVGRQRDLVEKVRANRLRESSLEDGLERQIALLKERRQALITAAVTGEMEVPGVSA